MAQLKILLSVIFTAILSNILFISSVRAENTQITPSSQIRTATANIRKAKSQVNYAQRQISEIRERCNQLHCKEDRLHSAVRSWGNRLKISDELFFRYLEAIRAAREADETLEKMNAMLEEAEQVYVRAQQHFDSLFQHNLSDETKE